MRKISLPALALGSLAIVVTAIAAPKGKVEVWTDPEEAKSHAGFGLQGEYVNDSGEGVQVAALDGDVPVDAAPTPRSVLDDPQGTQLDAVGPGEVVVLQPRRLAARLLAKRVAFERGDKLGGEVGYQVRMEAVVSARTQIRYVTEGILLRQFLSDPQLRGVSTIVFDEFHERHIYGDITLARALRLQATRPDLKIIVMSATLDAGPLRDYLAPCVELKSEGRMYPVEVAHAKKRIDFRAHPVWEAAADADTRTPWRIDGTVTAVAVRPAFDHETVC